MKKSILAAFALSLAVCLSIPAAATEEPKAQTFTAANGVLSIELPNENWKEVEDPTKWIVLSDGGNVVTIEHFSNGEKLPDMTVANDYYVNVYQAVFSTQNEVFIITGSVVDAAKIPEIANMIMTAKVLKYDTKQAIRKADTPAVSEFSVLPTDQTKYVVADGLNVRAGCSTDDQILGSFVYASAVHVTGVVQRNGEDYGWYQVSYGNGTGYVSANFLSDYQPETTAAAETSSSDGMNSGNVKTVYTEEGTTLTLYEGMDGLWRDREGTAYVRVSDTEFQVYEGTKRVYTYDITTVTNDYNPADYNDATAGVVTAYREDGTAVTLYESTDGYWYDRSGTAYIRHSDSDFQVVDGNKHVTVY